MMAPKDIEKMTFITLWDTFFYKVMSFGLKNVGATYQKAVVTIFPDMMHREIEVYVDDMIAKSKSEEEYLINLKKMFERLRKYKIKLNDKKYFWDEVWKTFGFHRLSKRGRGRSRQNTWNFGNATSLHGKRSSGFFGKTKLHCQIYFPVNCHL